MGYIASHQIPTSSPVSSIVFTSGISTSYSYYQIVFDSADAPEASGASYMIVQVSDDGGSTYKATDYLNDSWGVTTGIVMGRVYDGILTRYIVDGGFYLNNLYAGEGYPSASGTSNAYGVPLLGAVILGNLVSGAYIDEPLVVNALRIKCSDGSDFSGNFYLYAF